ncbi:MAG: 1,4-alpha-glucan branching protein GlgB [Eubacterium sp.]|nr:1,4-alpha-glucan branching protein GlgB [Eubacterium sp.]
MEWPDIEALEYGECSNPKTVLGARKIDKNHFLITAYFKDASEVKVKVDGVRKAYEMTQMDELGYFACFITAKKPPAYHFLCQVDGKEVKRLDPYAMDSIIDGMDMEMFTGGEYDDLYKKLGAHPMTIDGVEGTYFAVWAPNARSVSVVGDFNNWKEDANAMNLLEPAGIYELFIPGVKQGALYKYSILQSMGKRVLKADPFATYSEVRPDTASIVWDIDQYQWKDSDWLKARKKWNPDKSPMIVYEVDLSSFRKPKKKGVEMKDSFYNYRELADLLVPYVKELGYTHIELMPVMEHPYDASWGYQVTGYFAPTSRFGTPDDFKYFMDTMHQNDIGVIVDWVPAHFPKDEHGLASFDGTCLYEHLDKRKGEHPHWGTLIYNYGRREVVNFLTSNALYWLEEFHADGIRMDAVASMLYLDYGKNDGEWVANMYGGNENLEAIEFIRHINDKIHERKDGSISIAEESTAWAMVTGDTEDGGLGFDLKWNMGWMNDYLEYIQTDPLFRKGRHGLLTMSMLYQYSEKYMLVLSHDEVVHMKGSLYNKMPGLSEDKFASLRLTYGYMAAHPGKMLLFMGQEFGQKREWSEERELDWELLAPIDGEPSRNEQLRQYVGFLNAFYQAHPALYLDDEKPEGFEWVSLLDADNSVIAFLRKTDKETLLVVCNFTPVYHERFKLGVPFAGKYKEIFNSDSLEFGGGGRVNPRVKNSKQVKWDGREDSIEFKLAPLSMQIFQCSQTPAKGERKK